MTDTRSVLALILSVMILQLAGGLTGILTPLGLERLGVDASLIGFVAAMNAAGFMIGAWTAPRALALAGNIRLFAAGAGVSAAGILSLTLIQDPPYWALIRVLQGISFAYMFTSIESWLGEAVPARSRGNVMGVYHTAAKLSLIVGPFFLAGLSPLDSRSYILAGIFLALALVPVCLTRLKEPAPPGRKSMPLSQLFGIAPAAVVGVIGVGLVNTGTLALLPIYFGKFELAGGGTAAAAIAIAIAWIGGLIVQWPAGRLSDLIDRRLVIAGLAVMAGAAALLIAFFGSLIGETGVLILIAFWGAGALCFYGVCVSHAIDRTPQGQVPQVMSGLLFVWAAGSIVGPLVSGLAMRLAGPFGLFGFAGAVLVLLAGYMILRVRQRAPAESVSPAERGPILPSPLASAEIVPRDPAEGEEG